MNLVPSERVRRLADLMIDDAEEMPGADVFLRHARRLRQDDVPALVGLLLDATRVARKNGAPTLPLTFSPHERNRGYAAYRRGERTTFAVAAFREYQRVQQRRQRDRQAQVGA